MLNFHSVAEYRIQYGGCKRIGMDGLTNVATITPFETKGGATGHTLTDALTHPTHPAQPHPHIA